MFAHAFQLPSSLEISQSQFVLQMSGCIFPLGAID